MFHHTEQCADQNGVSIGLAYAWSGVLFFDTTIFGFTLYKALRLGGRPSGRLMVILLRDGESQDIWMIFRLAKLPSPCQGQFISGTVDRRTL